MSRRRFIADEVSGNRAALTGGHAAHLARVLRALPGQEFDIVADGRVRRGRIVAVNDERVEFELGDEVAAAAVAEITLLLAIFKFDRMEWAIEKSTELGVGRIVPLIAARTDTHLAAAADKRVERWRRLAIHASEQSRRARPPEIAVPVKFNRAALALDGIRIVLAESERQLTLKDALAKTAQADAPHPPAIALAIGPEGGWTSPELKIFAECGWTAASLGPTILRAETAAIAALAIVTSLIW